VLPRIVHDGGYTQNRGEVIGGKRCDESQLSAEGSRIASDIEVKLEEREKVSR
jgi:hypothetical protein